MFRCEVRILSHFACRCDFGCSAFLASSESYDYYCGCCCCSCWC